MSQNIHVVGLRRQTVDVEKLALALLDFLGNLSPEERRRLSTAGERVLQQRKAVQAKRKGSAA